MGRRGRRGPSRSAGSAAPSSAPGSSGAATRILPPLLASIALSILFVAQRWFRVRDEAYFVLFDDAMISMRYARNLVEGHGLVWNPGEAPVEGYTNFLWTLWMAVLHLSDLPDSKMAFLVAASGGLILLLNVLVVRSVALRLVPDSPAVAALAMWLTALCLPLVYWTLVGLEVGLLALLISLSMLLVLRLVHAFRPRDVALLSAVLSAAVLVRTDQVVLCVVALAFLGVCLPPDHRARTLLTLGLVIAATLGAHTAFRLAYYGDPLPNAYYLKVLGVGAGTRLARGLAALGASGLEVLYVPVAFAVVALWRATEGTRRAVVLPIAVFLGQCAYSAVVGGDAWEWFAVPNRFVTTGLPAALLAGAVGASTLGALKVRERRRLAGAVVAGFALTIGVGYGAKLALWATDGSVLVLGPGRMRWWALAVVFALLLGLAAVLGRRGAGGERGPARPTWRLVACGVVVLAAANAVPVAFVVRLGERSPEASTPAVLTRLALAVRDTTRPDASVAVVWAGMIPYFARRPAIDLLGRSDRTIARMPPRIERFWPGHTKWDYQYSIGRLRPDLIVQLWISSPDDVAMITRAGYDQLQPRLFARGDSVAVDRVALVCRISPQHCPPAPHGRP